MNPFYQGARFLSAVPQLARAPADTGREVAFAGRSNAGKSSAINALCHQNGLARASKTPGRTQQLVFFSLDEHRRLVDLPGYGYAKVAESIKRQWQDQMAAYLERRRSLVGLVIVMDIRHPLTELDRQMLTWSTRARLPVLLLLTKADKLKQGAASATRLSVQQTAAQWGGQVEVVLFSATRLHGVAQTQGLLDRWLAIEPAGPVEPTFDP
ncbi:MAG: YihA family ribosome biogenesis GTP-binding protein [Sphingobacteriia bacterium]|nr:YihA family ribosome biogenesis GTP-binding protein [Sphingobacteriia bacterium]NCC39243.1 YihA family ribosome biogenesis GTP-binding protein [Gammaproteobacteria bacterium]